VEISRIPDDLVADSPIRARVIAGLARNRDPGLHFAGNFAPLAFEAAAAGESRVRMPSGPHLEEADGETSLCALAMLADVALGVAIRTRLAPESRLATVALHLQLTGLPARGALAAHGEFQSFLDGAAGRQGLARVTLANEAGSVAFGSGAFMALAPPPGIELHPVVRERPQRSLRESDLSPAEHALLRHADASIARADARHAFISHFWGTLAEATASGARCLTRNGPQIANRVGHVQGGILAGLAAHTACAALGPAWALSSISSWFVSPGEGEELETLSTLEHRGRLTGVVRTVVTGAGGRRVLEAVSSHAPRAA
jgi:acyl-coenzyme A thioesterase PaaI-like protein